jgi:hypothetical protein
MAMKKRSSRKHRTPESKKISHLVREEGVPQRQAVAMALSMKRAGRLTKEGGYRRVGRKRKRGGRR